MAWSCLVREDRENSCWRTKPETQAEQATPRTAHYLLTLRNWSGLKSGKEPNDTSPVCELHLERRVAELEGRMIKMKKEEEQVGRKLQEQVLHANHLAVELAQERSRSRELEDQLLSLQSPVPLERRRIRGVKCEGKEVQQVVQRFEEKIASQQPLSPRSLYLQNCATRESTVSTASTEGSFNTSTSTDSSGSGKCSDTCH